jgi:hypothetical protein
MASDVFNLEQWFEEQRPPARISGHIRGPYQHHKDNLPELEPIFSILLDPPNVRGFLTALAKRTNICRQTLARWRHSLLHDPTWRPRRDHYGDGHRTFTYLQERELPDRIETNYIDKGLFYSDAEFKIDVLRFHYEIVCRSGGIMPRTAFSDAQMERINKFKASDHFIQDFRNRHWFFLRRPSFKRRPTSTEADMQGFVIQVQSCVQNYPRDRIINIDETNWRTVAGGFMTWAHTRRIGGVSLPGTQALRMII